MTNLWFGLAGLFALMSFALFVNWLRRWPVLGAMSIAANVLIAWELPQVPALIDVRGDSIYFLDILCTAFLLIAINRLPQLLRNVGVAAWFWVALGGLLCVSLLRGFVENPFGTTVNEFRSFFYPYAAMTWALSLNWSPRLTRSLIQRFAMALGWGLVAVGAYHISNFGLGSTSGFTDTVTGIQQTTRPLVAGQALILLICAIVCLWFWRLKHRMNLLVSALSFLCLVIVVQERTVWVAGIVAAIMVFLVSRPRTKIAMLVIGLITAWLFGFIVTANLAPDLVNKLGGAASDPGTYNARVTGWLNLITQSVSQGPDNVAFGAPMGSGFGRFEGGNGWVVFAPHNWYVTIYLRVGVIGLTLLVLFLLFVITKVLRRRTSAAAVAILSATVIYNLSYSWPWYICLFGGWAIATGSNDLTPPAPSTALAVSATPTRSKRVSSYGEI